MKTLLIFMALLLPSLSFAKPATLTIIDWNLFFSASGRTRIQNGIVSDIRFISLDRPSCSAVGNNLETYKINGDLVLGSKNTSSGVEYTAAFTYEAGIHGRLSLYCYSLVKFDETALNATLGSIANLR